MNFGTLLAKLLALVTAIQNSPALLAWFKELFNTISAMPEGALPVVDANDAKLKAALEQSPEVLTVLAPDGTAVPANAEAIGLGGLVTFITLLPQLIALLKALRGGAK